jgi:hypothetical protein
MRRVLLGLVAVVVALVLFGPALVQPWGGERSSVSEGTPAVMNEGGAAAQRPVTRRGCFGILRPGTQRPRPGCERIRERRGGVETRLGTVEIRRR